MVGGQQCALYVADREQTRLWAIRQDSSRGLMRFPYGDGIVVRDARGCCSRDT